MDVLHRLVEELALHCEFERLDPVGDWSVDRWVLTPSAVDVLVELYVALIQPIDESMERSLEADGIDLAALLLDEEHASDAITRSDMTELAAAASAAASHGLRIATSVLPNVPKGSRSASAPGIDVLSMSIRAGEGDEPLGEDEWLLVCSVKHTIADGSDMRSKLDASLRISLPYLTAQVRVLYGRMTASGVPCDRVYLTLGDFPNGQHLRVLGVGCCDETRTAGFVGSLTNLTGGSFDHGHIRNIVIENIADLHERIHA